MLLTMTRPVLLMNVYSVVVINRSAALKWKQRLKLKYQSYAVQVINLPLTGNQHLSEAEIDALLMDLFRSGNSETQEAEGSSSTEAADWVDWSTHEDNQWYYDYTNNTLSKFVVVQLLI